MVASIVKLLGVVVALVAGVLHLWYRGVLATPEVKRRKAAKRATRRA